MKEGGGGKPKQSTIKTRAPWGVINSQNAQIKI